MYSAFGCSLEVLSTLDKRHAGILNTVCEMGRLCSQLSKLFPFVTRINNNNKCSILVMLSAQNLCLKHFFPPSQSLQRTLCWEKEKKICDYLGHLGGAVS